MPHDIGIALTRAMDEKTLVRLVRSFNGDESLGCNGFVLNVSDQLVLVHQLSDRIDLDGFSVLRINDITKVKFDFPTSKMARKVLHLRKINPAQRLAIDLSNMKQALNSAEKLFSLIVIEREIVANGECEIGQLKLVGNDAYALRWITPDAEWESDNRTYRIGDITRLQFGCAYEAALALAAGLSDRESHPCP